MKSRDELRRAQTAKTAEMIEERSQERSRTTSRVVLLVEGQGLVIVGIVLVCGGVAVGLQVQSRTDDEAHADRGEQERVRHPGDLSTQIWICLSLLSCPAFRRTSGSLRPTVTFHVSSFSWRPTPSTQTSPMTTPTPPCQSPCPTRILLTRRRHAAASYSQRHVLHYLISKGESPPLEYLIWTDGLRW